MLRLHLVQLRHPKRGRRIALVEGNTLRLLKKHGSIYELAGAAMAARKPLAQLTRRLRDSKTLDYDAIHAGRSDWHLLPAFDHPSEHARCLVTGTGLTHKASAANRQAMHAKAAGKKKGAVTVSDSMRMYQWGLEGGRPAPGKIGVPPEWFYKGCGAILRGHGEPLVVPPFAGDGGEEPEVAGVYMVDPAGKPRRVGLVAANEFSDHITEKKNYLYLAPSKLRTCAIGPELIVNPDFEDVNGVVRIERKGRVVWSKQIFTGERNMSHTVANLEHHHFKYPEHRRPGDVHIHFFGADAFSFGEGIELTDGDVMSIEWIGFGRPLRNPIRIQRATPRFVQVRGV
jgi:hypothetical protein